MKFLFYILLFLIITNYWVSSINNLRTTTKFKFDDPELIAKSQAIWQKIINPSIKKGCLKPISRKNGIEQSNDYGEIPFFNQIFSENKTSLLHINKTKLK